MKREKDGEEFWVTFAVSGSLTVTLSKLLSICQNRGNKGKWARIARKLLSLQVREKACSLKVVGYVVLGRRGPIYSCWEWVFSKKP